MLQKFFAKMTDSKGQGLVEYALILFLIAIVVIGALTIIGTNVNSVFTRIGAAI